MDSFYDYFNLIINSALALFIFYHGVRKNVIGTGFFNPMNHTVTVPVTLKLVLWYNYCSYFLMLEIKTMVWEVIL